MSLTGLYFEGVEAQGERSLVIVMAAAYLFIAMMILIGNISALAAKWTGLKMNIQSVLQTFQFYSFILFSSRRHAGNRIR